MKFPQTARLASAGIAMTVATCATACSPARNSADHRPLEARLADEPLLFLAQVIAADDEHVTFAVTEKLKGQVDSTYTVRQGGGGDCGMTFHLRQRVLYAGRSIFGPTVKMADPPQADVAVVLDKLRTGRPLKSEPRPAPPEPAGTTGFHLFFD